MTEVVVGHPGAALPPELPVTPKGGEPRPSGGPPPAVTHVARSFQALAREAVGGPPSGPRASVTEMVGHVTLDDGGDLMASLVEALGKMTHGLPTFRPCWENQAFWQDYDPERVRRQSQDLAHNVQWCLDSGNQAGVHLGAGGRRLFPSLTLERGPVPPPPAAPLPRLPVAIDPLPAVTLPTFTPAAVTVDMGQRFGSDCATFYGTVPPDVDGFFQSTLRQVAGGQVRRLDLTLTSVGAVRIGLDGRSQAVSREAASYEAVDGRPGNAAKTRHALERARAVKARLQVDGQGRATVRVTASCDEVQSLLSVRHLRASGRELLQRLLPRQGVTCEGRPVHLTDNDGLAALRALSTGIQLQHAAYLQAIYGDQHLSPAERLTVAPGDGGSWAPDLLRRLQAGTMTADQAVLAAMARPALQTVLGQPPAVRLCRIGTDGKPHPLLVRDGKTGRDVPLMLSAAQGITLLAAQTVATPPSRRAAGRTAGGTVGAAGVSVAGLVAAWQGPSGSQPNAIPVSGQTTPLDLGGPLDEGEDAAVVALLAHVDDGGDVGALRHSRTQVEAELRHVAGLCRQGVLTGGHLNRQDQTGLARAIEAYLKQPDAVTLGQSRQQIQGLAGGGASAAFARALIQRMNVACRLEMALRALPAERQAPPAGP